MHHSEYVENGNLKKNEHRARRLWYDRRGDNQEVTFDPSTDYVPYLGRTEIRSWHASNIKRCMVWQP